MARRAHLVVYKAVAGDGPDRFQDLGNDPDLVDSPLTWGICRPDMRGRRQRGDDLFFLAFMGSAAPVEARYFFTAHLHVRKVVDQAVAAELFPGRENVLLDHLPKAGNETDALVAYVAQHRAHLKWADARVVTRHLDSDIERLRERVAEYVVAFGNNLYVHSWWDPHDDWRHRATKPYVIGGPPSRALKDPAVYADLIRYLPQLPTPDQLRTKVGFMYWHIPKRLSPQTADSMIAFAAGRKDLPR
jgi:hypothetical protein